jgi:hypothetical protein
MKGLINQRGVGIVHFLNRVSLLFLENKNSSLNGYWGGKFWAGVRAETKKSRLDNVGAGFLKF